MKNLFFLPNFRAASLALLCLCPLAAKAKNNPPVYPVQPIGTAPVIDGKLDDACWQQLPSVGAFVDGKSRPSPAQTAVRMGYDDKNLYVAVRIEEPEMDKIKADITQHDGGVWNDDSIAIFLAPTGQITPYFIFAFNSTGTTEESSMDAPAASFNVPWQCKVNREANAWTAEVAIPFSSLGIQKPNSKTAWYGNICRNRTNAHQISSWSWVPGDFHDPDAFGELHFLDQTVLNEVNMTSQALDNGVKVHLEARGKPAKYNTRLAAIVDGVQQSGTPELYNGFEVTPFKSTGIDNTYIRPEASRIVLQLEMGSPSLGGLVFRSEATVMKEIDELSVLLSGTAKALAESPPDQAPAAFRDLAPGWSERLAALQKNPELIPATVLHQEVRAAQWARNLPAASASQSVLLFPTYPFTEIWYDFLPDAAVVGTPVTLQAMRGEYAPACVNVLPMDTTRDVLVSVDNLKGPDGAVLPASAFDLRVLKAWYRDGGGGFQDPAGEGVWSNELLLKDDSIITSDPVKKRNTIRTTKDAATLQPVKIDRFMTRQFWLTAHIPTQQAPGLYSGEVRVSSNGKEVGSIPLQVRVLPLTLEKGKFSYGIYYQSYLGKNEEEDRWYEADMKSLAEHGFNNAMVYDGAKDKHLGNDSVLEYDLSTIRQAWSCARNTA